MYPTRCERAFCRARPKIANHRHLNPGLLPFDAFRFVGFDYLCQTYIRRANAELSQQKDEPLEISGHRIHIDQEAPIRVLDVEVTHALVIEIPDAIGVLRMFE